MATLKPFSGELDKADDTTQKLKPYVGPLDSEAPGLVRSAADTLIAGGTGLATGAQLLANTAGADNPVSRGLGKVSEFIGGFTSDYRKKEQAQRAATIKDAEQNGSTWDQVKAYAGAFGEAPIDTTVNALGTSAPTIAAAMLTGGASIPAQIAARTLPAALGAAQGVGAVKGSIYDAVTEKYKELGATDEAAAEKAGKAQAYGSENAGQIALGGALGVLAGTTGAESAVRRMATGFIGRNAAQQAGQEVAERGVAGLAKAVGVGALKEAPMESAQGGQERLASNLALQNEGFDVPTWQGVAGQAALEGLASAPMGGGFGALEYASSGKKPAPSPAADPATDPTQPPLALGFNPKAGTHTVFPDGSVILNSETPAGEQAVFDKRYAPQPATPSQAMGLDPAAGPMSAAAATAVDGGASAQVQQAQALAAAAEAGPKTKTLDEATPEERAAYDAAFFDPTKTKQGVADRRKAAIEGMLERAAIQGENQPSQQPTEDFDVPFGDERGQPDAARGFPGDEGATAGLAQAGAAQADAEGVSGPGAAADAGKPQRFAALNGQQPQAQATTGQKVKSLKEFMAKKRAEREAQNVQDPTPGTAGAQTQTTAGQAPQAVGGQPAGAAAGVPAAGGAGVEAAGVGQAGRDGYDTPVELDAASLKAIVEKARGESLVNKPEKLEAWRNGTAKTDTKKFPIELALKPDGTLDVNDGRHRIALAAERGEKVTAFVAGKDAVRVQEQVEAMRAPAAQSAPAATKADLDKLTIPEMTDAQLQATAQIYPEGSKRAAKARQEIERRTGAKQQPTTGTTDGTEAPQAQQATQKGPQAPAAPTAVAGDDEQGAQWNRMTTTEREAVATRAGLNKVAVKNLARRGWQGLDKTQQQNLRKGFGAGKAAEAAAQTQANEVPTLQSLEQQLFVAKNELENQGPVKNARTAERVRQLEAAIEEQVNPALFKAMDGVAAYAKRVRLALDFKSKDESVDAAARRALKSAGVVEPYLTQMTDAAVKAVGGVAASKSTKADSLQAAMEAAGWTPETADADNSIWTKRENGDKYTATLRQSGLEVTVPVNGVATQIASLNVANAERAAQQASKAVADDVAEQAGQNDELDAEMRSYEAKAEKAKTPKADPKPDALKEREKAAKAKMLNAAAKLADLLSKNTRLNITPEQEQAMLPIAIELFEGAMELGYVKFRQAAKYVRQFIANAIDQDAADALPVDTLQGAYIAVSRRHKDKAITPKAEVITVESVEDIDADALDAPEEVAQNSTETEPSNERSTVRIEGQEALDGVATPEGGRAEGGRTVGVRAERDGTSGAGAAAGADGAGVQAPRGGRGGAAGVRAASPRGAGRGRLGAQGAGRTGGAVPQDDAGAARPGSADQPGVSPEQAPASIPAANFQITADTQLGQGGEVQKFNDNIEAIRVVKRLDTENRRATPEEQRALARYVGWGGLANAFPDPITGEFKDRWQERGALLRELLTDDEYAAARRSTRNAHYTAESVVKGMWDIARRLGFRGGLALENSIGTGNFLGLMPGDLNARFVGVEYDSLTSRIAGALYPQATVLHSGFQNVPLPDNTFVLNIGNPPFDSVSLRFQYKPELAGKSMHNQFFLAGMDALRPGGLQIKVVSRYLLDAQDKASRLALAGKARLVGAIRLPDNAFRENARTEVVTDIVILQKLTPGEQAEMALAIEAYTAKGDKNGRKTEEQQRLAAKVPAWVETVKVPDPLGGEAMTVNAHFRDNPRDVLGVMERSGSMRQGSDLTVRLDKVADLPGLLAQAIDRLPRDIHSLEAEVAAATEQRFKSLSDSLRIALANEEPGHLAYDRDGKLQRVVERETPEGGFEFARLEVTPDTPWSEQLSQDAQGRWYKNEVQLDAEGKPVKLLNKDGVATKRNAYTRTVYATEAEVPASAKLGKAAFERLQAIVKMRDLLKRQLNLETSDAAQAVMEGNRRALAKAYEDFVAEHGPIGRPVNLRLTETMPDGGLVAALEVSYQPKRTAEQAAKTGLERQDEVAKPAPILRERVVPKYEPATRADTPADALAISLAETGRVNMERIAALLGKTEEEAAAALQDGAKPLVFKDPESNTWETANNYLSGMVKRKLNAAREAGLAVNVAALEAVQPQPWTAENVSVMLGSTWVPPDVYAGFVEHLTGGKAKVSFSALTNAFSLNLSGANREKAGQWSTEGAPVDYIVTRLLNSQAVVVTQTDSDGTTRIDQEATSLAVLKSKEISAEFLDWVLKDADRRARLVELFNEKFNTRVVRQYDGSHLKLPGKVPDSIIAMRRHQMNAIWRGIYERFLLVDHAVGAGKTFTAIARAMERRRMGLSQKPMVVVPNHLVEQWAADVYRLYPGAKVLAAGKKDFEAKRRRRLFARIATGDWDIVIVPHSSFGFIGIAPETEQRYLQREMQTAIEAVQDAWEQAKEDGNDTGRRKPFGVKEAERLAEKIQARMDNLNAGKKDRLLTFEQLGVDDLTVDEAHEFKNLYYSSRLTGVRGMGDKTGSRKANDLYNKVRVLAENPDASVSFLTGTPISNSAVEMFTMMRFLAADSLKEMGLEHFDAWRAQYVEATPAFEPTESGRLKEVTRLGRTWSNMRSLMDLYYQFTDAVSLEDIKQWYSEDNNGAPFPVPRLKGGDRKLVAIQPTAAQDAELKAVMAGFDGLDGIADPYERNAERLRLMDRARKLSLDMRAVDPRTTSKEEGGKLEVASREIKRIYDQWNEDKGTQLVFLDRSVPKSKGDDKVLKEYDDLVAKRAQALRSGEDEKYLELSEALERFDADEMEALRAAQAGGWNAYQQLKDNLVAAGIPANEIRFIQEATNDEQKLALFDAVNGGKVRVLIGSTPRMGAGTNVQQRAVALHHIDVTWKPSDIEQREGRVIRQGNKLLEKYGNDAFEVEILAYATERTVDAKMWDLNATKLRTINGIRKYDGAFTMEFEDADSVGMAEMAALASGNPLLLERVKLESELSTLELQERAHRRKMYGIQDALDAARRAIERNPGQIEREKARVSEVADRLQALEASVAARAVTVEGERFTGLPDAMRAAMAAIELQQEGNDKARFAITIDGERVTSKTAVEDAIAAAIGDAQPFEAQVNGKALTQRTAAAREVAGLVNNAKAGMAGDATQEVELGTLLGYRLVADVERKVRNGDGVMNVSITALDGAGRTLASESANEQPAQVAYSATNLRGPLERLFERIQRNGGDSTVRYLERQLADAQRDLPELETKVGAPFPKAGEMAAKRGRLAEVVRELDGAAPKAPVVDAQGAGPTLYRTTRAPGSTAQAQLSQDAVKQSVASALKRVVGAPPVQVVRRPEDLGIPNPFAPAVPKGVTLEDGSIVVFSDGAESVVDVFRTVFHELFHRGTKVRFTRNPDYITKMLEIAAADPMVQAEVEAWKKSDDAKDKWAEFKERGPMTGERLANFEALAVEEALATMAERIGMGELSQPQSLVQKLARFLGKVAESWGMGPLALWLRNQSATNTERFVMDTLAMSGGTPGRATTARMFNARQQAELASLFDALQAPRGVELARAQRQVGAHPMAQAIREVEATFLDTLAGLDDANLIQINC